MKIAVTYKDGEVFQHFGKSEAFKLYEIEGGKVVDSQIVSTNGIGGHDALAGFLASAGVNLVICGGMGEGAQAALEQAGIVICAGAEGNADQAVEAFLAGTLATSAQANCDHHEAEASEGCGCGDDCGCGCGDEEGCGGGCGGCGGGCGGQEMQVIYEGKNAGKPVRTHYRGTFNDGTEFDSSYSRNQPLEFICGVGMMIPGFDKAVVNMEVGETVNIHLAPEDAYGMPSEDAIFTVTTADLGEGADDLKVGDRVYLTNGMGQPFPVVVKAKDETTTTFDANHEMAGKELNFEITLVEVSE